MNISEPFVRRPVMTVLLSFVIPAFERMFKDFGGGKDSLQFPIAIVKGARVVGHHGFLAIAGPGD